MVLNDNQKESIIFLSSDSYSITSALSCGFNTVPIVHFEGLNNDDYQLSLVEQYLLRLKHTNCLFSDKIIKDFQFLLDLPYIPGNHSSSKKSI